MDMTFLQGKTNFLREKSRRIPQKAGVLKKEDAADTPKFSLEEDFLNCKDMLVIKETAERNSKV